MAFAGANPNNKPILEESNIRLISLLDAHLTQRAYIFGGRPAFGDFGLWGQLYQAWRDPTCHAHMTAYAPHLVEWIQRMLDPSPAEARLFRVLPRLPGLSYTRTLWRYVIASRTPLLPARAPPDRPSHRNSLWAPFQRRCTQSRRSSGKRWATGSPGRSGRLSRSVRLL